MSPEEKISEVLLRLLENKLKLEYEEDKNRKLKKTKEVLLYIAALGACFFTPNAIQVFKPLISKGPEYLPYPAFNTRYLTRTLLRLKRQKDIEIATENNQTIITVTNTGKEKVIKSAVETLNIIPPKNWDGRWHLVIYDVSTKKRSQIRCLRKSLIELGFLNFQKSVFVYPYPCYKEIELLRNYYGLSAEIHYLCAEKLESDSVFREYFNLQ